MNESRKTLSLAEVAQRLDRAGITWAVFAGAAAAAYGATHPVTDVDILIPASEGDQAASLFPEAQVNRREDGSVSGVRLPGFEILAGLTTMNLDVQMAARLTHHEIAGVTVPVIPPEDNMLLKAIWGRGPEQGKHDWEDVEAMIAHLPDLDWEYLRWRASVCGPQQRMQQALECLEEMWRRLGRPG
jgi:hypothetical protein